MSGKELDGRRTAKVVRVRDGERIVTDGPFAETKEIIGGVFLDRSPRPRRGDPPRRAHPRGEGEGSIEIRPVLQ